MPESTANATSHPPRVAHSTVGPGRPPTPGGVVVRARIVGIRLQGRCEGTRGGMGPRVHQGKPTQGRRTAEGLAKPAPLESPPNPAGSSSSGIVPNRKNGDQSRKLELARGSGAALEPPGQPGGAGKSAEKPAGPLQRALKESWRGYRAYHAMVKNVAGEGVKGEVRERLLRQLQTNEASCFWIAGVLTVSEAQLLPFGILAQQELQAGRLTQGVSAHQAIELLTAAKVALPVYWHNPDLGDIDELGKGKRKGYSPGPMHVLVDDDEVLAPHWLPIVAPRPGAVYRPPKTVLRDVLLQEQRVEQKAARRRSPKLEVASASENFYSALEDATVHSEADSELETALEEQTVVSASEPSGRGSPDSSKESVAGPLPAPVVPAPNPLGSEHSFGALSLKVPNPPRAPRPRLHVRPGRVGAAMATMLMGDFERAQEVDDSWSSVFFDAAYGWSAPPCEKRGPGGAITRWYLANTDESCRGAIQAEESLWRRFSSLGCKTVLVEARKEVLIGRYVSPGDWLYERDQGEHTCNQNLGADGVLRLESIETLECGDSVFELGKRQRVELSGGRVYNVAQLGRIMYVGGLAHWVTTRVGFTRDAVKRIGLKTQTMAKLNVASLSALPTDQAKVRALYSLVVPLVPDDLRGPINDVRNEHLSMKQVTEHDPVEVVSQVVALSKSVKSRLQRVPAFGNKGKRQPKSCVSCGQLPVGKYRWKHRICNICSAKLSSLGYTTYAGYQVQQNLHVPTCYPGIVKVHGEELPPKASKWAQVDVGKSVKCDFGSARVRMSRDNAPKRWDDFEKRDLERLRVPVAPVFTHVLGGIGCSGARPMVSARTSYNCAKALLGRVFLKLPPRPWSEAGGPLPGLWQKVREFVPLLLPGFEAPRMAFREWLETMPKRRRAALQRGWDRYERAGWLKSYANFTSFVKTELLPGFGKIRGDLVRLEEMLDRAIHGPSEESHCIAGPVVKPYVRKLKEIWGWESPVFYGSCAPEKLHKWLQVLVAEERQYFWCDFSMYDRTHSRESWEFVESLYGCQDPDFRRVMDVWRTPKGRFGPMKYQAPVCNASGRDDTALANALLNGFATYLSVCAAWLRRPVEDLSVQEVQRCMTEIRLSVCGDDSLGWVPLCGEERMVEFRADFNTNIEKFGFVAKLCTSTQVDECVYLGMRPYPTKGGWFWGKTIGRASYKMGWMIDQPGRDPMAHVTGIADMHVLCSSHVPVLSDLAKKIVELRQGARRTPQLLDPEKPWEWTYQAGVAYDEVTLAAVARVYSRRDTAGNPCDYEREVTVRDVQDLIGEIEKVERLPCVIDHWLWKHMVFSDDL